MGKVDIRPRNRGSWERKSAIDLADSPGEARGIAADAMPSFTVLPCNSISRFASRSSRNGR